MATKYLELLEYKIKKKYPSMKDLLIQYHKENNTHIRYKYISEYDDRQEKIEYIKYDKYNTFNLTDKFWKFENEIYKFNFNTMFFNNLPKCELCDEKYKFLNSFNIYHLIKICSDIKLVCNGCRYNRI